MEDEYSYVTYSTGTKIEKLEKLFVDCSYSDDFEFEALIKELDSKIKKHKERKDNTLDKKRKKKYSIIATMCMSFSIITISVIALYVIITDSEIQLNFWWFIVLVIIPLILWSIFDMKSNK